MNLKKSQRGVGALLAVAALVVGVLAPSAMAATADPQIDLAIVKTDSADPVLPGEVFDYLMTVTNNGPSGAAAVVATDVLPTQVEYVSASRNSCSHNAGVVTCALGAMAPGQSKNFTITVRVNDSTGEGTFVNDVCVENDEGAAGPVDTNPDNDCDDEDTTVLLGSIGDFVWHDLNSDGVQDPGEPGLPGVALSLDCASGISSSTATDGSGLYLFDDLPPGECTVTVTGPAGFVATTPTTVTYALGLDEDYLEADFGFVQVIEQIDLELTKDVFPSTVAVGGEATFTITVVNKGPADATGVSVGDVLPPELTYVSDDGAGAFDPASFVWTIGSLAVGDSTTLSFVVTVDVPGGPFVNVAEIITADQPDIDSTPGNGDQDEDDWDDAEVSTPLAGGLGDFVWFDENGDGVQDPGEPGIGGVSLTITGDGGTFTATTDSDGLYSLTVPPGTYTVTVNESTVSLSVDGEAVPSSMIDNTTPISRTGDVPDNGENLTFDYGFTVVLMETGFTSAGVGVAGITILLLGLGLLTFSWRGRRFQR